MHGYIVLILLCFVSTIGALPVEEFSLHGPIEFHDMAMADFIKARKENPSASIDYDSDFMKKARAHAVERGMTKAEEDLTIRVRGVLSCYGGKQTY